jgi:hypothetical protein
VRRFARRAAKRLAAWLHGCMAAWLHGFIAEASAKLESAPEIHFRKLRVKRVRANVYQSQQPTSQHRKLAVDRHARKTLQFRRERPLNTIRPTRNHPSLQSLFYMKIKLKTPFKNLGRSDVIALVGTITTILALFAGYHIAVAQGAFQKSDVEIAFEGAPPIRTDQTTDIFVSSNVDIAKGDSIFIPIEFNLKNSGDKELDNVVLSFSFDKQGKHTSNLFDESVYTHQGMMTTQNLRHEQSSTEKFDYSNFTVFKLNIGDSPMIGEGVVAYKMPLALPDNLPVLGLSDIGAAIKIQTEADNVVKKTFIVEYRIVKMGNIDQLTDWYTHYYAKAVVIEKRNTMSTFSYFLKLVFSRENKTSYLVAPEFQSISVNGETEWLPLKHDDILRAVSFKPYSWSLLFG